MGRVLDLSAQAGWEEWLLAIQRRPSLSVELFLVKFFGCTQLKYFQARGLFTG